MKSKVWAEGMIGKPKGSRAMLRSSSMHKDFMPGGGLPGRPAEQVAGDFTSDSVCWQRPFGPFAVLESSNTQVVLPVLGAPSMPTLLDMAQTMTKVRPPDTCRILGQAGSQSRACLPATHKPEPTSGFSIFLLRLQYAGCHTA